MKKRLLSLCISAALLGLIFWRVDFARVVAVFAASHPGSLLFSLSLAAPITLVTAWRFQMLMPAGSRVGFGDANRLILAASVLNLVLPSKMGDLAKAVFLREHGRFLPALGLALVVFEKSCDLLALLAWCVWGLAAFPQKGTLLWVALFAVGGALIAGTGMLGSRTVAQGVFGVTGRWLPGKFGGKLGAFAVAWEQVRAFLAASRGRAAAFVAVSLGLWFLHLFQIWCFTRALAPDPAADGGSGGGAPVPFGANLALAPLAILAGLLPLTFAGVGTRDAALLFFYRPFLSGPAAAALGILCTSRYLLPALAGLPLLNRYLLALRPSALTGGKAEPAALPSRDSIPSAQEDAAPAVSISKP